MSETSIQLRSQPTISGANTSLDSNGSRILPFGSTQAQKHAVNKPRFAEFACTYVEVELSHLGRYTDHLKPDQVYRYVVLVTNAVIPKAFWGSKRNLKFVLQCWRPICYVSQVELTRAQMLWNSSAADVMRHSVYTMFCRNSVQLIVTG
jgi:hypothetical protein